MQELEYPFDSEWLLKKKKHIKKQLLAENKTYLDKKIAVLGGSTTHDITVILELFLLNMGIKASFYESEYNQYWEDVMFDNPGLIKFQPDIVFVHTTGRNILNFPSLDDSEDAILDMLEKECERFQVMWEKIEQIFHCPIIQNNFEAPYFRLLGNRDVFDNHGRLNYINQLNEKFYQYAREHTHFFIHDINYLSACYGVQNWSDPFYWYMYKYALAVPAIPEFSYNLSLIIKAILGKNKKAFALDLDNTLWGGVIGEDGPEKIEIGHETAAAEMYTEFQQYLKAHKKLGVLLTVNSKNEEASALSGLKHPDCVLKKEDFVSIKANWNSKDQNLFDSACELGIGTDSFVFIDDNPAERHIIRKELPGVAVPELERPERFIHTIDRSGFFEAAILSEEDRKRNEMYQANIKRNQQRLRFTDYKDYLLSLSMKAEIKAFSANYTERISQLTNKSNQFNLTTLRCTSADIDQFAADKNYITLYGRLQDRFGDNGVVSVVCGHICGRELHINLWLMSCRVLKRDMEKAMLDALIEKCHQKGVGKVIGYYYPTAKNSMVRNFYKTMGFQSLAEQNDGSTTWSLEVAAYCPLNEVITVED